MQRRKTKQRTEGLAHARVQRFSLCLFLDILHLFVSVFCLISCACSLFVCVCAPFALLLDFHCHFFVFVSVSVSFCFFYVALW